VVLRAAVVEAAVVAEAVVVAAAVGVNLKLCNYMNGISSISKSIARATFGRLSISSFKAIAFLLLLGSIAHAAEPAKTFASPEDAVKALGVAANTTNSPAFIVLFGEGNDWLQNPDPVQGARELADFSAAFNATNHLVRDSESRAILDVGQNDWPFPIPLVKNAAGWSFDAKAGHEEIINRRIGRNELHVLNAMRAYVDAQREYASRDRDGSEVLKYAQKITSSPGKTDGLFWPTELNGEVSPLGPLVAGAQSKGYFVDRSEGDAGPNPFEGYFFKILTRQGKSAPGGKYNYIINGNMIGGFALVAWPVEYDESGVMTFIVNQQGKVYQKDLGPGTSKVARNMTAYDPDKTWKLSPD
jgi:hypothetical protein